MEWLFFVQLHSLRIIILGSSMLLLCQWFFHFHCLSLRSVEARRKWGNNKGQKTIEQPLYSSERKKNTHQPRIHTYTSQINALQKLKLISLPLSPPPFCCLLLCTSPFFVSQTVQTWRHQLRQESSCLWVGGWGEWGAMVAHSGVREAKQDERNVHVS